MPDLLLELFCEEIPARMQRRAAEDLKKLVTEGLQSGGLDHDGARAFATPRRLALVVTGVPARSPDIRDERKGPRVGAPDKAVAGFLRGAGLQSIEEAEIRSDPKKGDFYVAVVNKPGRAAEDLIADVVPDAVRKFPWPKAMRWGEASAQPGALKWVRPLHSVLCTFGPETEDPIIVDMAIDGLRATNRTFGHRFHAPEPITVRRFDDYVKSLEAARVVLDADRRRDIIAHDARDRALAIGLELVEDAGLLEEVAGLVEWPVVLTGAFDEQFLDLPTEVIQTTIRSHQKCFVLRDPRTGRLANRFVMVANLEADDDGRAIVAGNERVIRARLADARFFWQTDLKTPLGDRVDRLDDVVFHEKLGSQKDRVDRLTALAREIASGLGADPDQAVRAARLAKADLVTEMVGEFPELQGLMGRYYAEKQGEEGAITQAIEDHYKPQGRADSVPDAPVAISVALADKLDMLMSFWAISEKPTGSKDPYALRRAALGVIRIVLANDLRLPLTPYLVQAQRRAWGDMATTRGEQVLEDLPYFQHGAGRATLDEISRVIDNTKNAVLDRIGDAIPALDWERTTINDLLAFLADRLTVHLRDEGARHDLIDAVFALDGQDDLLMVVKRVEALGQLLATDDGENLLAGHRRAVNILRIEEKKDGRAYDRPAHTDLLSEPAEIALKDAIAAARAAASTAIEQEDFQAAMSALATLRAPVDTFFDDILVNVEDAALRENRLNLLNEIRTATLAVADFSRIGG